MFGVGLEGPVMPSEEVRVEPERDIRPKSLPDIAVARLEAHDQESRSLSFAPRGPNRRAHNAGWDLGVGRCQAFRTPKGLTASAAVDP